MAVLVGIDEAGYGPLLGPLVVSSTAFSIPDNLLKTDLWHLLKNSVSKSKTNRLGRLLVTDSKKAHNKSAGIKHLQRATLAFLKCLGTEPASLSELMNTLCPDCTARHAAYPWFQNLEACLLQTDRADISIAANTLKTDLAANGMGFLAATSKCLDVANYNAMVEKVNNKAGVLFTAVATLIKNAFDNTTDPNLQIIIDRQGGRENYVNILGLMFPDMELTVLRQDQKDSSYELKIPARSMRLHFVVNADEHYLPVSLASMISKYLRELLMERINSYFISHCDKLKPTAGYWQDGLRFIKDLKDNLPHVQYDPNQLIRCR